MTRIKVAYGRGTQTCEVPNNMEIEYGKLKAVQPEKDDNIQIADALDGLIGEIDLNKLKQAKKVAIAVSDTTRPVPSRIILEKLLAWLVKFGITDDRITILVGGGLHRPASSEDLKYILGEHLLSRINNIVAHDADCDEMLTNLGNSPQGTPVLVNKYFAQADYKIVTGMIDAHQFMGFTGGVKGAVIGLGGRPTITGNHARLFSQGAELGRIEGNPVRMDLEEIGRIIGVDMIVNVVLNDKKQVIKAVAGHPILAHRCAVEYAKGILNTDMDPADIVIASPGGFPKDINLYQAQKALTPALKVVRQGGTIILVAECIEGTGDAGFVEEMKHYRSPEQIVHSFEKKTFIIGPHKAYLWARALTKARTIVVSENIDLDLAKTLMVENAGSLQEAINSTLGDLRNAKIAVLPYASSLIPNVN